MMATMAMMDAAAGVVETTDLVVALPLAQVRPNPDQPRKTFREAELRELAASMAEHGLLQPIAVRPMADGSYQVIAGERRYRAAGLLGWERIPALVRGDVEECDVAVLAVMENCARANMRPLETARAFAALLEAHVDWTPSEVARRTGKSAQTVAKYLALLDCTPLVQMALDSGSLAWDLCTELARLSAKGQEEAAERITRESLGIARARQVCRLIGAREQQVSLFAADDGDASGPSAAALDARDAVAATFGKLTDLIATLATEGVVEAAASAMATPGAEAERVRLMIAELTRVQGRLEHAQVAHEREQAGLSEKAIRRLAARRAVATRRVRSSGTRKSA